MGIFGKKKPPAAAPPPPAATRTNPGSPRVDSPRVHDTHRSPGATPKGEHDASDASRSDSSSAASSSDSDADGTDAAPAPPTYAGTPCTMRLAIGVDGGGTGTTCVVVGDDDDEHLGRCELRDRSANANSVGFESALRAVLDAVDGALDDALSGTRWKKEDVTLGVDDATAGRRALAVVCAGIDSDGDARGLRDALVARMPGLARRLVVDNDAAGALASGTEGVMRGIAVVAGTGTVAFGVGAPGGNRGDTAVNEEDKDATFGAHSGRRASGGAVRARAGGWGPAFEDRGSGHHLGTRALNAAARVEDGRGPPTRLHGDVLAKLRLRPGASNVADELRRWAYSSGPAPEWSKVADLAPLVTQAAAEGDAVAVGIVNDAAEGLWEQIFAVYMAIKRGGGFGSAADAGYASRAFKQYSDGDIVPIVLCGGLLQRDGVLTKKLGESLMARESGRTGMFGGLLVHPARGPEWGAAWMARKLMDPFGR